LPPEEEWFEIGRRRFDWASSPFVATGTYGPRGRSYGSPFQGSVGGLSNSLLFLIDGNRLVEIDWRAQTQRTLIESPDIISIAGLLEPQPSSTAAPAAIEPAADSPTDNVPAVDPAEAVSRPLMHARIAVRMVDQITVLDPVTGAKREYTLPDAARERNLQVYATGGEQLLVLWSSGNTRFEAQLAWLATDGTVARQETVRLAVYEPSSPSKDMLTALILTVGGPVPIGWISGIFVAAPIAMLQSHAATSYSAAIALGLEHAWLGLVLTIALGAILAWWTYRLQRKYHRPASGVWCTFVALLGLPAFLAYVIQHRRPMMESCTACSLVVPRDRDVCAACKTPFPAPPLAGTEIFA
jgi:hypothetical protein